MGWIRLKTLPNQEHRNPNSDRIVYWKIQDGFVWHQGRKLRNSDVDSFEIRPADHRFIGRDHRAIYHTWKEVTQADRHSFEVLGDNYFRDKTTGFFEFETSLRPLKGGSAGQFINLGGGYARDRSFGYYAGRPLRNCVAPMTLISVEADPVYARDNEHVYFDGVALKPVDVSQWSLFAHPGFSGDQERVYFGAKKLPRVDVQSWRHLSESYSRDDPRIYHWHHPLKGCDLDSWEPIDHHYSKDSNQVYYFGSIVEGADAASFTVDADGRAGDKDGMIEYGRRTNDETI
ncbi:MAG: DKNYY domain-containing protein [Planctomycetota bacterium]